MDLDGLISMTVRGAWQGNNQNAQDMDAPSAYRGQRTAQRNPGSFGVARNFLQKRS